MGVAGVTRVAMVGDGWLTHRTVVLVTIGIFYMCKGTTMGVGNHTFRYVSMRFDTILFSSSSDAPRAWQAPRRRAHDARQLALSGATICREIDHHSAHFLPREVGIRKFGSTYVRSKNREIGRAHV